jgi:hypothetical protein
MAEGRIDKRRQAIHKVPVLTAREDSKKTRLFFNIPYFCAANGFGGIATTVAETLTDGAYTSTV